MESGKEKTSAATYGATTEGAPQGYVSPQQPQVQMGGGPQQVFVQQPVAAPVQSGQVTWMPQPQTVPGCPPGLEYLTMVDQLLVHQQVELIEMLTDIETVNRYQVKNSVGQQIYFALEESDFCHRCFCGARRGFTMHITDNHSQEVIRLNREFKCCAGCCWCADNDCCAMDINVEAPVGNVIGYVRQSQSWWNREFTILNVAKETILRISGPCCLFQNVCFTNDIDFMITTDDRAAELGKVSKQWGGLLKEVYTKADNFSVTFPMDLSVDMKTCLLGAVFLIDFMYFENPKNNNHRH